MKASLKILTLTMLFLILYITSIYATGISMNLEDYNQTITTSEPTNVSDNNVLTNESESEVNNTINQETNRTTEDTSPRANSTTTSTEDEFLTVENILSIIIIVIGILLILLAVAILVRFK